RFSLCDLLRACGDVRQTALRRDVPFWRWPGARARAGGWRNATTPKLIGECGGLDCSADRHDLVGVYAIERRHAGKLLRPLADERDAGRAADEDDVVEVRRREPRKRHGVLGDLEAPLHERIDDRLKLPTREAEVEVEVRATHAVRDFPEALL